MRLARKLMFPDKARMVRSANALWLSLTVAPALYLVIGALLTPEGGIGNNGPTFVRLLFFSLAIVSASNLGVTVFMQREWPRKLTAVTLGTVNRTFLALATGSILSEAHAIYGLILTLLSGSIYYGIGFSMVSWASLLWVRQRFKQNLQRLPDDQPSSKSQEGFSIDGDTGS